MNRNLNVFWGLVLCVGMIVGLTVLTHRSVSESDYGNPNEFYNSSSARTYSHVSSSAAVADGIGVPMRSTSSMRRGGSFVYAPAYTMPGSPIASSPNGPIASSPISYTSSSATAKSFGSGIGAGVSMSGGAVRSASGSVSMSGGSISSPISLPSREGTGVGFNSPLAFSPIAVTDPAQAAASYEGIGNTTIGGPRGMRGRQKGSIYDSWLDWLYRYGYSYGSKSGDEEHGYTYSFTDSQMFTAYNAFRSYWDEMWGTEPPDFDTWYAWFRESGEDGYNYKNANFKWQPVGEIWPLLVIALLYALFLAIKSKPLKSLLTAKRSE